MPQIVNDREQHFLNGISVADAIKRLNSAFLAYMEPKGNGQPSDRVVSFGKPPKTENVAYKVERVQVVVPCRKS